MTPASTIKSANKTSQKRSAGAPARTSPRTSPGTQTRGEASPSFFTRHWQTLGCCLVLFAAVLAFYSSVTRNDFIGFDDPDYILNNKHVQAGLTWETVKWAFVTNEAANWHPLTWLSHALDYQLFGLSAIATHWTNVALHGLGAVILFLLLQYATGYRWRSLMVAALFALHPINVESVAWASERKNVLSMLFCLLALYAYVWYTRKPAVGRYAAVAGLFALSLLAKPQVVAFPFLLLLFDYWPLQRFDLEGMQEANPDWERVDARKSGSSSSSRVKLRGGKESRPRIATLVWEKVPLLLLSAANAIVTMFAQTDARDPGGFSLLLRLETAVVSYVRYLGKAFWPSKLIVLYPHPMKLYPAWQAGGALLLLLLITALVCARLRRERYLAVGWFWFLGSLVPMIGLVQVGVQAMADRYAYLSFIGLFLMVVWLVTDGAAARRISAGWLAVPAVACLLALGVMTYRQTGYWHDSEILWQRALAMSQDNYVANRDLAAYYHKHNREEDAVAYLRASLAINPQDLLSNLYYAAYEHNSGNLPDAITHFQFVEKYATRPRLKAEANKELGEIYLQMGDAGMVRHYFDTSLRLVPDQPKLMVTLGVIAQKSGNLQEAIQEFEHAAAREHSDVEELLVAQALQQAGRSGEANAIYRRVARRSANLAAAQKTVSTILGGN